MVCAGTWEAPTIPNPEYKGEWHAKMIDNPAYKGIWVAPDIDNPEYEHDDQLYHYKDSKYVGFELWQVKAGSIFDNILVADSYEEAEKFANDTWGKTKDAEKKMHDEIKEEEKKKAEEAAKSSESAKEDGAAADDEDDEYDEDKKVESKDEL